MYKLILSNSKEMSKVLSGGKIVWKNNTRKLIGVDNLVLTNPGNNLFLVKELWGHWDMIRISGVEILPSDGRTQGSYNQNFIITNPEKIQELMNQGVGAVMFKVYNVDVEKFQGGDNPYYPFYTNV